MPYRHLLIALFCLFFLATACKQASTDAELPEADPAVEAPPAAESEAEPEALVPEVAPPVDDTPEALGDIEKSMLWRIDGPNGPLWLFGTIHVGVDFSAWHNVPIHIRQAIRSSTTVVIEADLDEFEREGVAERIQLPPDQKLSSMLSRPRWQTLVETLPIADHIIERFQPWFAYSLLVQGMIDQGEMMDRSIYDYAKRRSMKLDYLESVEDQLDILAGAIGLSLLNETLDNLEPVKAAIEKLVAAYKSGDAEAIEAFVFDEELMKNHPEYHDLLFIKRNQAWLPKIEALLEEGNVFVAVGAGHLFGDQGLLNLLSEKGHDALRVVR